MSRRSSSNPARPHMVRLIVIRRLLCPSTGPVLQGNNNAARTAAGPRISLPQCALVRGTEAALVCRTGSTYASLRLCGMPRSAPNVTTCMGTPDRVDGGGPASSIAGAVEAAMRGLAGSLHHLSMAEIKARLAGANGVRTHLITVHRALRRAGLVRARTTNSVASTSLARSATMLHPRGAGGG